jgi:hypothetical protein
MISIVSNKKSWGYKQKLNEELDREILKEL